MYIQPELRLAFVSLVVLLSWAAPTAAGQTLQSAEAKEETTAADADYRIGPGDLLAIAVAGIADLDTTARVSNSGKIHLPHLGIIEVDGTTVASLEARIAGELRQNGLVKEPWVAVRITEYRAQPVYILGEVMMPGQFVIKKEMHLIDLVTMAWGFAETASPIGYLYRRKPDAGGLPPGEAPTDEAIPIDFDALNDGAMSELNIRLRGGDVLYVPLRRTEQFYLIGDVISPGSLPLEKAMPATRALAIGGGTLRTAKMSKAVIVRFNQSAGREELPLDLDAILKGRKPDVMLQANDILYIPGSTMKTFSNALLGVLPDTINRNMGRGVGAVGR